MFKHIEPWNEPVETMKSLPAQRSEMSSSEQGFLCGMMRKVRPKKILEVGVAAGGTSCVIMEALERLCLEDRTQAVLHSVDLNERYYRDRQYPTGYMAADMTERCPHVRHETHYGAVLPEYIEEIGDGIDLLILDTTHTLPGEILDFLLALPYLRKNATVVLHDIMMPLLVDNPMSCATNTLLGAIRGDKYLTLKDDCAGGVDNIGAFTLTSDTVNSIENIFFTLLKRWSYELTKEQEEAYRKYYSRYYDKECLHLFTTAITLNRRADYKDKIIKCYSYKQEMERVLCHWKTAQMNVVIYGIGYYGQVFVRYAQEESLRVDALCITDGEPIHKVQGCELPVYELSNLPYQPEDCIIIIAVQSSKVKAVIEKELRYKGYFRIL